MLRLLIALLVGANALWLPEVQSLISSKASTFDEAPLVIIPTIAPASEVCGNAGSMLGNYFCNADDLYTAQKAAGEATFNLKSLPRGVLIVRGSSGWTRKIIR
jgi:hypothetical protein